MPIWPLGYAAHADPFRVVDFDGVVVVKGPEARSFGGGHVPFANFAQGPPNRCGASSAWVGAPIR